MAGVAFCAFESLNAFTSYSPGAGVCLEESMLEVMVFALM